MTAIKQMYKILSSNSTVKIYVSNNIFYMKIKPYNIIWKSSYISLNKNLLFRRSYFKAWVIFEYARNVLLFYDTFIALLNHFVTHFLDVVC